MHIAIGCDHKGLDVKQSIIKLIAKAEHSYEDFGCYTTDPVDYPDIAKRVAEAVARRDFECGILICSTGIGMTIAANKVKGIRAALCYDVFSACLARQHNDANILCLGAEKGENVILEIVDAFLTHDFEGERHLPRLNKIKDMEG
ncbi:putative sugar phosphate isomerase YwlF [subsurface metagenome]